MRERAAALGVDLDGAELVDPVHSPLRDALRRALLRAPQAPRHDRGARVRHPRRPELLRDDARPGGRRRRHGVRRRAHDGRHDPARLRDHPAARGHVGRLERLLHVPARPRARLRRLRRQSEARPAAAGGHRDQLGRDGRAVRRRAADRDALLLDGRVRVAGRTSTPFARRPRSCGSGVRISSSRGRSSTTPRSTPRSRAVKLPDSRVAGQATVLVFPDLDTGQRRLQGGAALLGRGRDRTGAPGPAQAGQRPQPRLHRHGHRQHRRHHRDPGAGVRRPRRPSDQAI